jgi:lactate dehydrogenase-like 2-hydroxyacid dehydrogenase
LKSLLITRPLPDAVLEKARGTFQTTVRLNNLPMQSDELRDALRNFDMVLPTLGDAFDAQVFADVSAPRCKLLANFGVGYNHIDVEAAAKANVLVSNTPGAVTDATADVAMTLILMSARRAGEGERLVRSGQWKGWHPTHMLGLHVTGKTVGIAGMGRIGQAIAQRCHYGFGMAVKYWSRSEKDLPYEAERIEDLAALAAQVDILVAAVPGGAETQHLFNAEVFGAMQSHAHFINISRGEVVKESALIAALQNDEIGGAGLDVYEFEPRVPDALRKLDTVTLLPHLGTAALEIRTQMGLMAVDNLLAYEQGETPPNLV